MTTEETIEYWEQFNSEIDELATYDLYEEQIKRDAAEAALAQKCGKQNHRIESDGQIVIKLN